VILAPRNRIALIIKIFIFIYIFIQKIYILCHGNDKVLLMKLMDMMFDDPGVTTLQVKNIDDLSIN
jgi:hypothetical protein